MDYKEYTRLRDIVVKRNKRAVTAGLMSAVHFPTVAEIKEGYVDFRTAMRAVKDYYSSGSQVSTIRQTGLIPDFIQFQEQPKPVRLTDEIRRERKRQKQREYRRKKAVRETATTPQKAQKYEGYLKALETVSKTWKKAGVDIGISVQSLTPKQLQGFVEYMEYRFAQGDYTQKYVIDEFIQDFSKLLKKGYSANTITSDFEKFMENRYGLSNRAEMMEGISGGDFQIRWDEMIGD